MRDLKSVETQGSALFPNQESGYPGRYLGPLPLTSISPQAVQHRCKSRKLRYDAMVAHPFGRPASVEVSGGAVVCQK